MKTALAILIPAIALLQSFQSAFAAAGDYIVTDTHCACLRHVDHITGAVSNIAQGVIVEYGVAVDSNGDYIVTNSGDPLGRLVRVDRLTGAPTIIATNVWNSTAIAIDSSGNYVVSELSDLGLFSVSHSDGTVTPIRTSPPWPVYGIAVDSNGNYVITGNQTNDCGPNTEYLLALVDHTTGNVISIIYSDAGNDPHCYVSSNIGVPTGIAIDSDGNYIVADAVGSRLFSITPNGGVTLIAGGLGSPNGVVINSNRNYVVTDSSGGRLLLVDHVTHAVSTISSNGLVNPRGIAIQRASVIPTDSSSTFRITAISRQTSDISITWQTITGSTNELQATSGDVGGNYNTNNFNAIFSITNVLGSTTNYLDVGGATNTPSRYYRVRLVP